MSYIMAYDPVIKRRVVHVVKKGIAHSMASDNSFKVKKKKK